MSAFKEFGFGEEGEPVTKVEPKAKWHSPPGGLTIELVPKTSWGDNLRSRLAQKDWNRLRKMQYREAMYRCEICGEVGRNHPIECHETWEYDEVRRIQKLTGLIALCPDCHRVKHFGFAAYKGKKEQALRHLMRVNGWDRKTAIFYVVAAFERHRERSRGPWILDLQWLKDRGVDIKSGPA